MVKSYFFICLSCYPVELLCLIFTCTIHVVEGPILLEAGQLHTAYHMNEAFPFYTTTHCYNATMLYMFVEAKCLHYLKGKTSLTT